MPKQTPEPAGPRRITGADLLAAAANLPPIDARLFFADLDERLDPEPWLESGER